MGQCSVQLMSTCSAIRTDIIKKHIQYHAKNTPQRRNKICLDPFSKRIPIGQREEVLCLTQQSMGPETQKSWTSSNAPRLPNFTFLVHIPEYDDEPHIWNPSVGPKLHYFMAFFDLTRGRHSPDQGMWIEQQLRTRAIHPRFFGCSLLFKLYILTGYRSYSGNNMQADDIVLSHTSNERPRLYSKGDLPMQLRVWITVYGCRVLPVPRVLHPVIKTHAKHRWKAKHTRALRTYEPQKIHIECSIQ